MSVFTADPVSGGSSAGGLFNLSDADLIAQCIQIEAEKATDLGAILVGTGGVPSSVTETWGILIE
jgi:hypothetical protein